MNYELAKELKDAGFPQKERSVIVGNEDNFVKDPVKLDHYFYVPTLSELIEACPREVISKNKNTNDEGGPYNNDVAHLFRIGWGGQEWYACYEFYYSVLDNEYGLPLTEYATTPEEAVARLWLALRN